MKLLTELHLIEGQRSNIYLWQGQNGLIMIDAGSPGDEKMILDYLEENGFQASDLAAIFITHADIDHAGTAAAIQAHSGAMVYASAETADLLARGKSPDHMPRVVQFILDHFMGYAPVEPEAIHVVAEGDELDELTDFQVLATPGHTLDHHSIGSDVHGILFAGDALNARGGRLKSSPKRVSADYETACQSAMRLLRLHPAIFACGHGLPLENHDATDIMALYRQLEQQVRSDD
jgi:glyoxylase-like metal-dependent hydrolase (beta-lactamase superfamily II)